MKRALFKTFGKPEDVIEIVDVELDAPERDEVEIDIEAASVHLADLKLMAGTLTRNFAPPTTPGVEAVGRITQIGSDVRRVKPGDRVFLPVNANGQGTWHQKVILKEADVIPAPEGDAAQLSLVPINALTSYVLLNGVMPLTSGDWIIQNAANSNCGRLLIALAQRKGVKTINVVRRDSLIPELHDLGADVVLLDGEDLAARVRESTGGAAIKLAIDAVAGWATQRLAECIEEGASILAYGFLSGEPCMVKSETLFQRNLSLRGFLTTTYMKNLSAAQLDEFYAQIPALVAAGSLKSKIAATYTFDQIKDAVRHAALTGEQRDGKIIILPNG